MQSLFLMIVNLIFSSCHLPVEKYEHLCSGEAQAKVDKFLEDEHTFEEYCQVSLP